ncbi:hypothetical protein [Cellulomonas endometrii]|uniref:hypothetical protein n=1 Tax=Cellulomonas endometrii TaxID=3036301 RepID=UPI0024AD1B46|nr:hypothetical protein [Cellulomonas endometrii]
MVINMPRYVASWLPDPVPPRPFCASVARRGIGAGFIVDGLAFAGTAAGALGPNAGGTAPVAQGRVIDPIAEVGGGVQIAFRRTYRWRAPYTFAQTWFTNALAASPYVLLTGEDIRAVQVDQVVRGEVVRVLSVTPYPGWLEVVTTTDDA